MVPRNTAFGSGLDASERMRTSSRSLSSRSMVPMNTAPPDDLDGDGGEAARPLGFDGALFVSSAVPDAAALGFAAETAPPSAVFFLGARLRRRLFFSVLAAPPPGGAVAPSPSEAAARFRANVGVRRVICGPGVRARRGATGATTRADIPVAPLVLPGLAPCVTRACEAAACAIMTDGVLRWCRDAVCRPAEQGGGLFTAKKLSGSSFTGGSRQRRGFTNLAHVKGTGIFAVKSP